MNHSANWEKGYHVSTAGKTHRLKDLPTAYLVNIADKYRSDHDVSIIDDIIEKRDQKAGE